MKKLVLSLVIVAGVGMHSFAQESRVKFGVKAGVTFPTLVASGDDSDVKTTTSFYVGGTATFPVSNMFSLQSGLSLVGKGAESSDLDEDFDSQDVTVTGKAKIHPLYLEIPLNAIVNFEAGSGKFYVGAGPYYAFGVGGKIKADVSSTSGGTTASASVKEDIKFGNGDEDTFKSGDFGVNFLAGYQLNNGFNIQAGYGLGLSNVFNIDSDIAKVKNRVFSVGIGYSF